MNLVMATDRFSKHCRGSKDWQPVVMASSINHVSCFAIKAPTRTWTP